MISWAFNTLIYTPFYNGLVFLIGIIPGGDAGIAVILLTILVKFLLFPLALKSIKTQVKMKQIEPRVNEIKERYKDNKQEQAAKIMALYHEGDIKPFASFLVLLIQIPVIFGLYFVFIRGGLPEIHTDLLYPFINVPGTINMHFLGILDISQKSLILAIIAGILQFVQAQLLMPPAAPKKDNPSIKDDLARSMNMQMRFVFPVFIAFIASRFPAAVPLYWATSNVFSIAQELYVRKTIRNKQDGKHNSTDSIKTTQEHNHGNRENDTKQQNIESH